MIKVSTEEEIITARCRLRYPTKKDFPEIWTATRYPGFNEGMAWDPPDSMEDLHAPLERSHINWAEGTAFDWTVETRQDAKFIGRVGLYQTENPQEWSLGYWTHPSRQKQGFATETAVAVVEFGFSRLDATRIIAAHATWNAASGKVLCRAGMKKTGFNPKGFKKSGKWVEEFEYEIVKS